MDTPLGGGPFGGQFAALPPPPQRVVGDLIFHGPNEEKGLVEVEG